MIVNKIRRVIVTIIVFVIAVNDAVSAGTVFNQTQIKSYLDKISSYQMSAVSNPGYGSTGGEWTVMALARYGSINKEYIDTYKTNLKAALDNCNGVLSKRKYTEYSRVVIALTAIGENPADFSGYNLLSPLYDYEKVASQGANGMVYALLALDCGDYNVTVKDSEGKTVREKILDTIKRTQLADGGWSSAGTSAEADITAMVIQALVPYMADEKIKNMIEKGFTALSGLQNEDGGFSTLEIENCEAVAQVLTAMSEAGVSPDDSRFVKNGNTVLDALLDYYKNGAFSHIKGGSKDAMATDQAMYALVSYERKIGGKNRLFDMSDGLVIANEEETTSVSSEKKKEGKKEENHKNKQADSEGKSQSATADTKNKTKTASGKKKIKNKKVQNNKKGNVENSEAENSGQTESKSVEKSSTDKTKDKKESVPENVSETVLKEEDDLAKEVTNTTKYVEENESSSSKDNNETIMNSNVKSHIIVIGMVILLGGSGLVAYNRSKFGKKKVKTNNEK